MVTKTINPSNENTGTSGTLLQGQGIGTASAYTTATYPATTSVSQILYSSSANVVGGLTTANGGVLITSNTGVPSILAGSGTSGQVLQAVSGAAPAWSTPTYPSTSGSTGVILRSDGTNYVATTNTFPNTATTGDILIATGTNVIGSLADVAVNQVLVSGGVGVAPAYSATPTVTSITFGSGTALSNYAEGTFTPTMYGITTAGTTTYSNQTGTYTRVGRLVNFSLIVTWSAATGTGFMLIGGFPFNFSENYSLFPAYYNVGAAGNTYIITQSLGAGASVLLVYAINEATGGATGYNVSGTGSIRISGTYQVF